MPPRLLRSACLGLSPSPGSLLGEQTGGSAVPSRCFCVMRARELVETRSLSGSPFPPVKGEGEAGGVRGGGPLDAPRGPS